MNECEPCRLITECLRFPLVFYDLGNGRTYRNPTLGFIITCPDGSTVTRYVQEGEIEFFFPYPPGFQGDYSPLVLPCAVGGNIVRQVPSGSTQSQIDEIVNGMILECAKAIATSNADCVTKPATFSNDTVYFVHDCGAQTLAFSGTLPSWITIDTANSRLVGASGTFSSNSKASANATAQAALNGWATQQLSLGNLFCQSAIPLVLIPADVYPDHGWGLESGVGFAQVGPTLYGLGGLHTYTSTDGLEWTEIGAHFVDFNSPSGFAYGAGVFVAIDNFTNKAYSSPDGITWTGHALGFSPESIAFGAGVFVVVGTGGSASTSPDGLVWSAGPGTGMSHARSVTFGAGLFVAVGESENIASSPDGVTWTTRSTGFGNLWCVGFANSLFIAGGNSGSVYTSANGIAWTPLTVDSLSWRTSGGGGGIYVLGASTGEVFTSTDGVNFSLATTEPGSRSPIQRAVVYWAAGSVIDIGYFFVPD